MDRTIRLMYRVKEIPQTNIIKTYPTVKKYYGLFEIEGHFLCIKIPLAFEQFAHRFEIFYYSF